MRGKSPQILRRTAILIPLVAGLLVGVAVVVAGDGPKVGPSPDTGASDADRAAEIKKLQDRNAKWLQDFIDQQGDPSSLPVTELPTYSAGAMTLDAARQQSIAVLEGTVQTTAYVPDPGGLTKSIATLTVGRVVRGDVPATIQIQQIGGPAWSPSGGELQELEGDPLLLPGQQVILLVARQLGAGIYQTVYGAGVYVVNSAGVQAPDSNAFATTVNGLSVDAVLSLLR